jgi:hypothetical protein
VAAFRETVVFLDASRHQGVLEEVYLQTCAVCYGWPQLYELLGALATIAMTLALSTRSHPLSEWMDCQIYQLAQMAPLRLEMKFWSVASLQLMWHLSSVALLASICHSTSSLPVS